MRLTPPAVGAMIAEAFPHWAGESITPASDAGTAHALFRLGADNLVRIPLDAGAAAHVRRQGATLAAFAKLPLEVPRELARAQAVGDCPFPWSILNWIEGETAMRAGVDNWDAAAAALGQFVAAMRACDTSAGLPSGRASARRGMPLVAVDPWMRSAIAAVADLFDPAAMTAAWDAALAAPAWPGPPVWVHGDLHGANLLVRGGRLAAVIDFGLASLGDPACDLAPAWTLLPAASRGSFSQRGGARWRSVGARARLGALCGRNRAGSLSRCPRRSHRDGPPRDRRRA